MFRRTQFFARGGSAFRRSEESSKFSTGPAIGVCHKYERYVF